MESLRPGVPRWDALVDSGLRLGLAVVIAGETLACVAVARLFLDFDDPRCLPAVLLLGSAVVTMFVVLRTGRGREAGCWVVTGLVIAGLDLAAHATRRGPGLADTWWPTMLTIATLAFLTLIRPRNGWIPAVLVLMTHVFVRSHTWVADPGLPGLTRNRELWAGTGQLVAMTGTAWVAGLLLRRAAADVAAANALAESERTAALTAQADRRHQDEVDRVVHDEILQSLRTVAMVGEGVGLESARAAGEALRRRVSGGVPQPSGRVPVSTDAAAFLDTLDLPGGRGRLRVIADGTSDLALPPKVRAAFSSATREALRNTAQHSGADEAVVEVSVRALAVTVEIRDRGTGFWPQKTDRRGLSSSVTERMRDVGGAAEIVSAPGEGTVVRLTWSPVPRHTPTILGGGAFNALFPMMMMMAAPSIALGLWFPLFVAGDVRWPTAVSIASVVLVLVGFLGGARALRHGLSGSQSCAITLVAWAATAINGLALPHDGTHPRLFWIPAAAGSLTSLLAIYRRLREAVISGLGVFAIAGITSAMATPPGLSWAPYVPPVTASLINVSVAIAVRHSGERIAFEILRAQRAATDATLDAAESTDVEAKVEQRLDRHRCELLALADAIATPEPRLPLIAQRASAMEATLREELMTAPHPALAAAVAALRDRGWAVRLRVLAGTPPQVADVAADGLRHLDDGMPPIPAHPDATRSADEPGRMRDPRQHRAGDRAGDKADDQGPDQGTERGTDRRRDPAEADLTILEQGRGWRIGLVIRPSISDAHLAALRAQGWVRMPLPRFTRLQRVIAADDLGQSSNDVTGAPTAGAPQSAA